MPAIDTPPTPQRSATMRAIKGKGTKPELALEAALEAIGFPADSRNDKSLPGSPDFVFRSARVACFVDSRFWHGLGHTPRSNAAWWEDKLARNYARDRRADAGLRARGWLPWRIDAGFALKSPEAAAYAAKAVCLRRLLKMMTVTLYLSENAGEGRQRVDGPPLEPGGPPTPLWIRVEAAPAGMTDMQALDVAEPRDDETLLNTYELGTIANPNDADARPADGGAQ